MAGQRKPGPVDNAQPKVFVNDGTLCRQQSPTPGPLGIGSVSSGSSAVDLSRTCRPMYPQVLLPLGPSGMIADSTLEKLRRAVDWPTLHAIASRLLGGQSFTLGVVYGLGENVVMSVADLVSMFRTLCLADMHDRVHNRAPLAQLVELGGVARRLSAHAAVYLFADELREAHLERTKLIEELAYAVTHPAEVFESVKSDYVAKWNRFEHTSRQTLEDQFQAGRIFGEVLLDVLLAIGGAAGAVKAAAKIPRLATLAGKLRGVTPRPRPAGVATVGRGGTVPVAPPPLPPKPPAPRRPPEPAPSRPTTPGKWQTTPTGEVGGKPTGRLTVNKANADPLTKRSVDLENRSADRLAKAGYKVEQNPNVPGNKKPDYRIEGELFDCYAPQSSNPQHIVQQVNKKVGEGQADRIVLNLEDSTVSRHEVRQALSEYGSTDLKEIVMIDQSGNISRFYP